MLRCNQIDDKGEADNRQRFDRKDTNAAHLDQPRDGGWRTHVNGVSIAAQFALVVGDKPRTGVD